MPHLASLLSGEYDFENPRIALLHTALLTGQSIALFGGGGNRPRLPSAGDSLIIN
jgi:hypothetical protein